MSCPSEKYSHGKCVRFAVALWMVTKWKTLVIYVENPIEDDSWEYLETHAFCEYNGRYIDFEGSHTKEDFIKLWTAVIPEYVGVKKHGGRVFPKYLNYRIEEFNPRKWLTKKIKLNEELDDVHVLLRYLGIPGKD
jgi:hypothetical protein